MCGASFFGGEKAARAKNPTKPPTPADPTPKQKKQKLPLSLSHLERPSGLLDDVDRVQVRPPLEAQHRVDRQLGKVLLLAREDFRRERRARHVGQMRPQQGLVALVVERPRLQGLLGDLRGLAVARDDRGGVHLGADELLGLAQELAREHDHAGGAVADLVVLDARDVCWFLVLVLLGGV